MDQPKVQEKTHMFGEIVTLAIQIIPAKTKGEHDVRTVATRKRTKH